jgi:hypothetical protein
MRKVIIGIHGLGNKPPKYLLQKWWKDAMIEGLNLSGIKNNLPDFELVYWADILYEKPLNRWEKDKDNPYFLDEPYIKAPKTISDEKHPFREKIFGFISDQLNNIFLNEDNSLNYSFITDAILKKYFRDLEVYYREECKDETRVDCKARDLIQDRLVNYITKYRNHDIMIIAHSMGSIITFDVLNFLIPEARINTLVTIGSPLGLPIVVSKIAAEQQKKIEGQSIMATPPGVTSNWFNFADIKDHVAINFELSDDFRENERGILPTDFLVNNNYVINGEINHHKSFGYLRTPEFSKILGDFIADRKLNMAQKVLKTLQDFLEKVKEQYNIVKDKLAKK